MITGPDGKQYKMLVAMELIKSQLEWNSLQN